MTTTCRTSGTASRTKRTYRNKLCELPGGPISACCAGQKFLPLVFPGDKIFPGTVHSPCGLAHSPGKISLDVSHLTRLSSDETDLMNAAHEPGGDPALFGKKGESRWTSTGSFARTAKRNCRRGPRAAPTVSAALPGATPRGPCRWAPCWQAPLCRAQPRGGPAGGHPAGRPVYGGGDAEHRRRGHPLPRGGKPGPLPGDHQGIPAHHPLGRAGQRLSAAPETRQRGAAQDHPDGLRGPLPLHPADHPGHRP